VLEAAIKARMCKLNALIKIASAFFDADLDAAPTKKTVKFFLEQGYSIQAARISARAAYAKEYRKTSGGKAARAKAKKKYDGTTGGKATKAKAEKEYKKTSGGKAAKAKADKKYDGTTGGKATRHMWRAKASKKYRGATPYSRE